MKEEQLTFIQTMVLTVLKLPQVKLKCVFLFFYFVRLMASPQQLKEGVDIDILYQKNKIN